VKEIKAYIKRHKLGQVTFALQRVERLRGMSVSEVKGWGRREETDPCCPGIDDLMDSYPYAKIEIVCEDDLANELISVIDKTARTGLRGDGKIYISNVERAVKIGRGDSTQ
jgi:nitrogen regulatory protein PII